MEIQVSHTISMGHRLPSYDGICSSPHGHNIRVVVRITTHGFFDFKVLHRHLADLLDAFDHAMVLQHDDPLLSVLRAMSFRTVALSVEPTTEAIAQLVYNELRRSGLSVLDVTVHETDKYAAIAWMPDTVTGRVER